MQIHPVPAKLETSIIETMIGTFVKNPPFFRYSDIPRYFVASSFEHPVLRLSLAMVPIDLCCRKSNAKSSKVMPMKLPSFTPLENLEMIL